MQLTPISIKSLRKKGCDFEPQTIGDHVRKKRLLFGLTQKQVAKKLRVSSYSVLNWERGKRVPLNPARLGRIIAFLGYDPVAHDGTVAGRLKAKRRALGWSQERFAKHLGIDPGTLSRWEAGARVGFRSHRQLVARLLAE